MPGTSSPPSIARLQARRAADCPLAITLPVQHRRYPADALLRLGRAVPVGVYGGRRRHVAKESRQLGTLWRLSYRQAVRDACACFQCFQEPACKFSLCNLASSSLPPLSAGPRRKNWDSRGGREIAAGLLASILGAIDINATLLFRRQHAGFVTTGRTRRCC